RGFLASMPRSASRLNAIAALRAATMQIKMPRRSCQRNEGRRSALNGVVHAMIAARSANGSANTVWLNRTISKMWRTVRSIFLLTADQGTASRRLVGRQRNRPMNHGQLAQRGGNDFVLAGQRREDIT